MPDFNGDKAKKNVNSEDWFLDEYVVRDVAQPIWPEIVNFRASQRKQSIIPLLTGFF